MKGGNKMTANELRIGNLVKANYRGISIICDVVKVIFNEIFVKGISAQIGFDCRMDDDKCEYEFSGDPEKYAGKENGFEPISLTEEWLRKFGFECRESTTAKEYYLGLNSVTNDWLFSIVWLDKPESFGYPNAPFYRNGRHTLYYVHQLQNLYFALTGEELTIKKPLPEPPEKRVETDWEYFRYHTLAARATLYPGKSFDEVNKIVDDMIKKSEDSTDVN